MKRLSAYFYFEDWKNTYAHVMVWAWIYNFLFFPSLMYGSTILTLRTDLQWPAPPLIPWEHLLAGTTMLGMIGTVQIFKDRERAKSKEPT